VLSILKDIFKSDFLNILVVSSHCYYLVFALLCHILFFFFISFTVYVERQLTKYLIPAIFSSGG